MLVAFPWHIKVTLQNEQWEHRNQEIIKEIVIIKCEEEVTWKVVADKSRRKMLWLSTTVPVAAPVKY